MPEAPDGFDAAFNAAKMQLGTTHGSAPFRALGHDRGRYYFLPKGTGQVVCLRARDLHSAGELVQLARLGWWENAYPGGRESFSIKQAGDELMRSCERVGVYDPDRLRGRGVWLDAGRTVMHLGDVLRVDGRDVAPSEFESRYIYEQSRQMPLEIAAPLSDKEAAGLLRLCCEVGWEKPDRDRRLLAGFLVSAMLCGGMPWRPHLWITGESGEGKSWVFDNIIKPVLRHLAIEAQGFTSEAGIRGRLGSDARPIIFDEAEPDEGAVGATARMQQVLHLARQASSEDGGAIIKGTKDGGYREYRIRSSFVFSSINISLTQAADESRTIVLNMAPHAGDSEQGGGFDSLKSTCADVMVKDFGARLLARMLSLLPVIRANSETLADTIARQGHSRRTGDTLGVVLAGAYALASSHEMTAKEAAKYLEDREWIGEAASAAKVEKEWAVSLAHLVQGETRLIVNGRPDQRGISELIGGCLGRFEYLTAKDCEPALRRCGLLVRDGWLLIANQSEFVADRFKATRWAAGWPRTLARAPGAKRGLDVRYSTAFKSKSLAIPLGVLIDDAPPLGAT
jgi:putative DNA primase/helicase